MTTTMTPRNQRQVIVALQTKLALNPTVRYGRERVTRPNAMNGGKMQEAA
ncbi:MAG: hypothetical protein PHX38_08485 [Sulfuricella sp.]|nr:hypothetical protein [Sulfuricella sp.]